MNVGIVIRNAKRAQAMTNPPWLRNLRSEFERMVPLVPKISGGSRISSLGEPTPWGVGRPPMWVLFGENLCGKNERFGIGWGVPGKTYPQQKSFWLRQYVMVVDLFIYTFEYHRFHHKLINV